MSIMISSEHHDIKSEQPPKHVKVDVDLDEPLRQGNCVKNYVWVACGTTHFQFETKVV